MIRSNAVGRSTRERRKASEPQLRAVATSEAPAPDRRASKDGPARVQAFFAEQLPWLIRERADLFNKIGGELALFVEGAGCWTVRFGKHDSPDALRPDATFESDCVTVFSVESFLSLLDGTADGQQTVMLGDGRLLSRLGQLMIEPGRGQLGARLNK